MNIESFIWGISDDVLRGLFKQHEYGDVILPFLVLRRLDCVQEEYKDEIVELYNESKKKFIKKTLIPHKLVKQQEEIIKSNNENISQKEYLIRSLPKKNVSDELSFQQKLRNFSNSKYYTLKLNENYILEKYQGLDGFYYGINNLFPGSGYLGFHQNKLVILSSRGILGYESKNEENILHFKQIKNNINNFIGEKQFSKGNWFSLKDLLIHNDQIYVSFTEEIKI